MLKVKKTTASGAETSASLSFLDGVPIPESAKARVKRDVGDYLVEQILIAANGAGTLVSGESMPKLSKGYLKKKLAEGLPGVPNLESAGDLLDSLEYKTTDDGIDLGWFSKAEAPKADGHANFSGDSTLPRRRIIPGKGQSFDSGTNEEIQKIIGDAVADNLDIKEQDLDGVETKADLYSVLGEFLDGLSRAEIKAVVARTPGLVRLLDDLDLFNLL